MIFQEEVKDYVKHNHVLQSNLATVYAIIWGQCSENMQVRVKAHKGYETKSGANDCLWLLTSIRSVTLKFDSTKFSYISLLSAQHSFLKCKQEPGQSVDRYVTALVGWTETIEAHSGTIAVNYKLVPEFNQDGKIHSMEHRQQMA
jgi:hypothetical protein